MNKKLLAGIGTGVAVAVLTGVGFVVRNKKKKITNSEVKVEAEVVEVSEKVTEQIEVNEIKEKENIK